MDPYKIPESDLSTDTKVMPKTIYFAFGFIVLSFIIFLIEELTYASEEGPYDIYNYLFIPVWAGILYWVSSSIRTRSDNPKNTFLILALLVAGMSIYTPLEEYSIYTDIGEAVCFLFVFLLLNAKESKEWFS
ncbi:hypothetical protein [Microbulbifer variabilis]|uniref:hypothetical protein n=1 Tax=Microbulbifer variabilis TaxID=266805 RepID=UPI00037A4843|nr:hypothetical protein [Microbulbifer variabilis]